MTNKEDPSTETRLQHPFVDQGPMEVDWISEDSDENMSDPEPLTGEGPGGPASALVFLDHYRSILTMKK